jgi:hypothetical protein
MDEAGFSLTLPNSYSWSLVGQRLYVPYEAPQGRRVNAVGAFFHGAHASHRLPRRFAFLTRACVPKTKRKAISSRAAGLDASELGILNAGLLIGFIWQVAGRPENAPQDWRREKPLVVVLDNYSVHKSAEFQQERVRWQAADIDLFFLPSYSPELSAIEPVWREVKQHRMRRLSRGSLCELKRDVDAVLAELAQN